MRPAIKEGRFIVGALGLLLLCLPVIPAYAAPPDGVAPQCAGVFRAASTRAAVPIAPQVQHDERTNTTFFFSAESDGAVRVKIAAADMLQAE